jgi:ribonuclease D
VAQKLIASSADLDAIAAGERDLPALRGWRAEVFGADALRLCEGEIALSAKGNASRISDTKTATSTWRDCGVFTAVCPSGA